MRDNPHYMGQGMRGGDRGERGFDKNRRGGQKGSYPSAVRSAWAINLGRLAAEVDRDVLSAALGFSEPVMVKLIEGRENVKDARYSVHLSHSLNELGLNTAWLDIPEAPIDQALKDAIRARAASAENKAPIRRSNFKRLARAFDGRLTLFADALELVEGSVAGILEGRLELDDQRFSHLNPRLMAAGFPNGWLEQSDAALTDAMIQALEVLATDEYEMSFESYESDTPQAFVNPAELKSTSSAAEDTHPPFELVHTEPIPPAPAVRSDARQDLAEIQTPAEAVLAVPDTQQSLLLEPVEPQTPPALTDEPESKELSMTTKPATPVLPIPAPDFPAAGFAPTQTLTLPRGKMAAGRSLDDIRKAAKKDAEAKAAEAAAAAAPAPAAAPVLEVAPAAVVETPAAQVSETPAASAAEPAHRVFVRKAAQEPVSDAEAEQRKQQSLARAAALHRLLDSSRRGAKVCLWRDMLGSSLPYWGNIRNGGTLFRDELVEKVEEALQLPKGWHDNPTFPPATIAPWVFDAGVPLPAKANPAADAVRSQKTVVIPGMVTPPAPAAAPAAPEAAAPKATGVRPFARKSKAAAPTVAIEPTPAAPVAVAAEPVLTPAVQEIVETPAPVQAAPAPAPVQAAPAPAPAPVQAQVQAPAPTQAAPTLGGIDVSKFVWNPAPNPIQLDGPGPLTQALVSTLNNLATEGKFTEHDAISLIYYLLHPRT